MRSGRWCVAPVPTTRSAAWRRWAGCCARRSPTATTRSRSARRSPSHRYLELQKIRFADRLQVRIEIAPEVRRARVPRLILQPLLENAIRHGVERSRTAVVVEIRAGVRGQRLAITVRDHGGAREAGSRGQGIGLANTRARLAALYGGAHVLEIAPTEGGGLAIRIEVPLQFALVGAPAAQQLELDGELLEDLEAVS